MCIANHKNYKVTFKRGIKIAICEPVLKVTHIEEKVALSSQLEISVELIARLRESWSQLSKEQLFKTTEFLKEHTDIFVKFEITESTEKVQRRINTGSSNSIKQSPKRIHFAKQQEVLPL